MTAPRLRTLIGALGIGLVLLPSTASSALLPHVTSTTVRATTTSHPTTTTTRASTTTTHVTTTTRVTTTTKPPVINPTPWSLTVGLPPSAWPTNIYPFMSARDSSTANTRWFQHLMYRPLYWMGTGTTPALNSANSLALDPVYNSTDTSVTITVKSTAVWSDGSAVSPADIVFWLNLLAAYPSADANYLRPVAGVARSLPDLISSVTVSGNSLTLNLSRAVNPTWFTANQLASITPLPAAWDVVPTTFSSSAPVYTTSVAALTTMSTVSGGCHSNSWIGNGNMGPGNGVASTHDVTGVLSVATVSNRLMARTCTEVRDVMSLLGRMRSQWAQTSALAGRLFALVDGPWRLSKATDSELAYVQNSRYSLTPVSASTLVVTACGSLSNCARLVAAGKVDWAPVSPNAVKSPVDLAHLNLAQPAAWARAGYRISASASWADPSAVINNASTSGATGSAGVLLRQTWFRHFLNAITSQALLVKDGAKGAAISTAGPVPGTLGNPFGIAPPTAALSLRAARQQLAAHGFSSGACVNAALCGVALGTPLSFSIIVDSSDGTLTNLARSLSSQWARAGVALIVTPLAHDQLVHTVLTSPTQWDFALWANGYLYYPNVYPSGENHLATGSQFNVGHLSDSALDTAITASLTPTGTLAAYDSTARNEAVEIWLPSLVALYEARRLTTGPINPLSPFMPESWRR